MVKVPAPTALARTIVDLLRAPDRDLADSHRLLLRASCGDASISATLRRLGLAVRRQTTASTISATLAGQSPSGRAMGIRD